MIGRLEAIKKGRGSRRVKPEDIHISRQVWRKYQRGQMSKQDLSCLVAEMSTQLATKLSEEKARQDVINVNLTLRLIACKLLHDDFGFGNNRLQRFLDGFDGQIDALSRGYVKSADIADILKEECGIEIVFDPSAKMKREAVK